MWSKMNSKNGRTFWKSAGLHLVERNANGWLIVTPDYLRAYLTRPEIHPVDESCDAENALFEALMTDPFRAVPDEEISAIADPDAAESYRLMLRFRDCLAKAGTIEGAYLSLFSGEPLRLPPVFLDQMVHLILRNILFDVGDPVRLRAAELFFRDQSVNLDDGRMMLADFEVVETHAETGGMGGLGQLLKSSETPMRAISLDVLDEDTGSIYWERSDRFDTVIDFRFTLPAVDAFARVIEAWVAHFYGLKSRVKPVQSISDERWNWHIGLDADASSILNALYAGETLETERLQQILGLFTMEIADRDAVIPTVAGKPIYLALAMDQSRRLKIKPQNLLMNLPLGARA